MSIRLPVLLLIICSCFAVMAQDARTTFRLTDAVTGEALSGVKVLSPGGTEVAVSDSAGIIAVFLSAFANNGFFITMHPGYMPDTVYGPAARVELYRLSMVLPSATVSSSKVSRIGGSGRDFVVDYDVVNGLVLAIVYSGAEGKKAKIQAINFAGKVLHECVLPQEPVSLFRSCIGHYYCICTDRIYQLAVEPTGVSLLRAYTLAMLPRLRGCLQMVGGNRYYLIGNEERSRMVYTMIAQGDSVFRVC